MNSVTLFLFIFSTLSLTGASPIVKRQAGRKVHVVILDAGSSGTRIHLFKFIYNKNLQLEADLTQKNKPGLSSFAGKPQEAVQKVKELMQLVATEEEAELRPEVLVKATAGLRLLDKENPKQAQQILNDIEQFLRVNMSRYIYVPPGGVGILPGIKEGTYFWLAANYLLGVLGNYKETYGTLELGGASTQITFSANKKIAKKVPDGYIDHLEIFGKRYRLYSHSYLNYGINEARLNFFPNFPSSCRDKECLENLPLLSPCLNPAFTGTMRSTVLDFPVKGSPTDDKERYDKCLNLAAKFVEKVVRPDLSKLKSKMKFLASGAYYGILKSTGANLDRPGGITISEIEGKTKEICQAPAAAGKLEPYACMSLTYIIAILRDGYGFSSDHKITFAENLNGYDVGWPLGLALHEADRYLNSINSVF